jgi:hypothetical protein
VFSTQLYSELGLGVNMKVVGVDVCFPMDLVLPLLDIHNLSYDQTTTRGSTQSCTLSRLRKTNLLTILYSELSISLFMNVVGMDFIFKMALVASQSDIDNVSYDQNTTHRLAYSCTSPSLKKINVSTVFCLELDLGVFMKDVDKGVCFHFPLVRID